MTDRDLYGHEAVYVPTAWPAPDPCPIPELVLFPRLARVLRRWTRRHR